MKEEEAVSFLELMVNMMTVVAVVWSRMGLVPVS